MKNKVYLLHGLMGTSEEHFAPQLETLKEQFELIPMNLPGHGDHAEDASDPFFESTLAWVYNEIKSNGKGIVVGLSLGASIAMHLAVRYPEVTDGIVLTGYTPIIPDFLEKEMQQQYEALIHIEELNPEAAAHFKNMHGERWFQTLRLVLDQFTFHYPEATDAMIEELKIPMLFVNGSTLKHERDAICHVADLNSQIIAGLIPQAGHLVNIDQWEIFNRMLLNFIESLDIES